MDRVEHTVKRQVCGVYLSAWGPDGDFRIALDFREGDSLVVGPSLLSLTRSALGENLAAWAGQSLEISITGGDPDGVGSAFAFAAGESKCECDGERDLP